MVWKTLDRPTPSDGENDDEIWKPTVMGENRIGKLIEIEKDVGKFDDSILYHFEGDPTNPKEHQKLWKKWGNKNLNSWMQQVEIGTLVRVIYKGSHPTKKGNPWQEYEVQVKDEGETPPQTSSKEANADKDIIKKAVKANATVKDIVASLTDMGEQPTVKSVVAELKVQQADNTITRKNYTQALELLV